MKKTVKTTLSLLLSIALLFALAACGETTGQKDETATTAVTQTEADTTAVEPAASTDAQESEAETQPMEETAAEAPSEEEPAAPQETETDLVDGMRPEIKEAIDDYEAFFDEYCTFMETYSNSDDSVSMLADYASFLAKYAEAMEGLDALGEEDLNDAELAYYIAATARIEQKLLEVAY